LCLQWYDLCKNIFKTTCVLSRFRLGQSTTYDDLKKRNIVAIEKTAWLRKYQSSYTEIHLLNPCACVDIHLCELLNLSKVIFATIGYVFIFEGTEITIQNVVRNANIISININNQSPIAFPINNNHPLTVTDDNGNTFPYENIQTSVLHPNSNQVIQLNYTVNPNSNSLRFKVTSINA